MNLNRWDIALIAVGVMLILPLVFAWANYLAPLLALVGLIVACGVIIHRCSKNLAAPAPVVRSQAVPHVGTHVEVLPPLEPGPMRITQPTQDVLPLDALSKKQIGIVRLWNWLWNHPNHAGVMLGSALWILNPLDGDFIIVAGWVDDLGALVLFVKHAGDVIQAKWGKRPLLVEKATELDRTLIPSVRERLPVKS